MLHGYVEFKSHFPLILSFSSFHRLPSVILIQSLYTCLSSQIDMVWIQAHLIHFCITVPIVFQGLWTSKWVNIMSRTVDKHSLYNKSYIMLRIITQASHSIPNYSPKPISLRLLTCLMYVSWRLGTVSNRSLWFKGQDLGGDSPAKGR